MTKPHDAFGDITPNARPAIKRQGLRLRASAIRVSGQGGGSQGW